MMDDFFESINALSKELHCYLRPTEKQSAKWRKATKLSFDYLKSVETDVKLGGNANLLKELYTDGLDTEQIWQQIELQNESLLAMRDDLDEMDKSNLCYKVASLCNSIGQDNESADEKETDDESELLNDEAIVDCENEEESGNESDSSEKVESSTIKEDSDEGVQSENEQLNYLDEKYKDFNESEESEDEGFEFGEDILGKEGEESDEEENEGEVGDSDGSDEEELDMNKDKGEEIEDETENFTGDEENETENFTKDEKISDAIEEPKSTFEKELEKEREFMKTLEEDNISEKPWFLSGEVRKEDRPENSTLEEHMQYNIAVKPKPDLSNTLLERIERTIISRINIQAFDDVERKVKPTKDPFEYKKSIILDQEKSKKSLTEIYEEEYLKLQEKQKSSEETSSGPSLILSKKLSPEEQLPEHSKIRNEMDDLFIKLNALSNCNYTPKMKNAELKIVSNVPVISVEDTTPVTTSDANLLAPEEVVVPLRGDPKAKIERSKTDKKRDRRRKKLHQKQKHKLEKSKLSEQMKKKTVDGLTPTSVSVKAVEKALKKGQVKVLDQNKTAVKSSSVFFKQLQDEVSSTIKKRKLKLQNEDNPKTKKRKNGRISKVMLL